jgi:hypothetical protein
MMELKVGKGTYEGKEYTYLYVDVEVNGKLVSIRLKCSTSFEKDVLVREIMSKGGEK